MLRESRCALLGGHTCEGQELSLGFCVTGHVAPEEALRKGGMSAGEVIVLTKPLGTVSHAFLIWDPPLYDDDDDEDDDDDVDDDDDAPRRASRGRQLRRLDDSRRCSRPADAPHLVTHRLLRS